MSTRSLRSRERDELLHLLAAHRRRLLDEDVLARLERLLRELVVRRHGRRDRRPRRASSSASISSNEPRHARLRVARRVLRLPLLVGVADPGELGELADDAARRSCPSRRRPAWATRVTASRPCRRRCPRRPVAFRRSTTRLRLRRRAARSRSPEWAVTITTQSYAPGSSGCETQLDAVLGERGDVRVVVGDVARRRSASSSISFTAGDSRMSAMSAL